MANYIDPDTVSWLVEHYRPHNRRLQEFLGRSLEHWDHPFERARAKTQSA
jgi:hypothetical protein